MQEPVAPPMGPRLVIVSIDGLRPDALAPGGASTLLGLAGRGTYTWAARTVNPSTTVPSHVSMLTGYPPSFHRITWDDWKPEKGYPAVPTILQLARAAGLRTSLVVGKDKLKILALPGSTQFFLASGTEAVANQAVAEIASGVDVLVVHFPEVDLTGHATGWMSPAYLTAVGETDRALGRIVDALGDSTTLIVTGDHGGTGRDHGAGATMDMLIPWVAVGPTVPRGRGITRGIKTVDTAATAARFLGLSLAPDAEGRVITEAIGTGTPPAFGIVGGGSGTWRTPVAGGLFLRPEHGSALKQVDAH
jgi:arylsulfatase A-like enzyme